MTKGQQVLKKVKGSRQVIQKRVTSDHERQRSFVENGIFFEEY
jgi:hypothetical protein